MLKGFTKLRDLNHFKLIGGLICFLVFLLFTTVIISDDLKQSKNIPEFVTRMTEGKKIYQIYCVGCHQLNGEGQLLGAPALRKGLYNSSYLTIDKPITRNLDIVLNGVQDTPMPGFKQILNDEELASVITYIRNAWNNDTGDLITPQDIKTRKNIVIEPHNTNGQTYTYVEQMNLGKTIYRAYCARCHQLNGKGKAPFGPKLDGSYLASEQSLIPYKIDLLLQGASGTRMRSFAKELSDTELSAVSTYIANAWQNHGHGVIQPQAFAQRRKELLELANKKDKEVSRVYSYEQLMSKGKIGYMAHCARCHLPDGAGGAQPGVSALKGSTLIMKSTRAAHIDVVLLGVPGSIMRAFGNRLTNLETAAILTYERNAWGNNKGDLIQPAEVQKRRVLLQKMIDFQDKNQLIQQDEKEQRDALKKK
ncbi:c-type cytochrome [Legionella drancourtii]|uniref:Cytochrome c domain-containing protein n=1 Tax=Legionella drancourtii LLAP12 TaxID=658187 RepID=G9ENR3_9GAMM|nr:c-type cytochrome [Legionella drancourtii]EHL31086.1 hypothetical protein LDG_6890 [Legionella drancourtii LLAP12]